MENLFGFINDITNYQDRVIGRYDGDDEKTMVSTARVSDGRHPYETAFRHPDYNEGKMVIVEAYDSKDDAAAGHSKWVKVMTDGPLPDVLIDCENSGISEVLGAIGGKLRFERKV
jgi:hypothetical protein